MANGAAVLIVDDDEGIRETLKLALELRGYATFTAVNGRDGLETLRRMPRPCLILLDLMMPIMDGRGFVNALQRDPTLAGIPVIIVTAFGDRVGDIEAKSVMPKPVSLQRLYDTVREYCSGSSGQ